MPKGIDWFRQLPECGVHIATSDDATANKVEIETGKPSAIGFIVQAYRAGVLISGDIKASISAGVLTVEDGSTYKITAGDVINWIAF